MLQYLIILVLASTFILLLSMLIYLVQRQRIRRAGTIFLFLAISVPVMTLLVNEPLNRIALGQLRQGQKTIIAADGQGLISGTTVVVEPHDFYPIAGSPVWRFFRWGVMSGDRDNLFREYLSRNFRFSDSVIPFFPDPTNPTPAVLCIFFMLLYLGSLSFLRRDATNIASAEVQSAQASEGAAGMHDSEVRSGHRVSETDSSTSPVKPASPSPAGPMLIGFESRPTGEAPAPPPGPRPPRPPGTGRLFTSRPPRTQED